MIEVHEEDEHVLLQAGGGLLVAKLATNIVVVRVERADEFWEFLFDVSPKNVCDHTVSHAD